ncbi:DNA-formamidopyrimidine glycosylase [Planktothrix agardhii]|uniref:Formamidopyrimidine-DNA glycosylase n=1 Tax=Planktothrix agardhii TaxID=1160 RepID=A0AAD1Q5K1_PLAAG|nr:DNA-formamidopyrimidine glycosylase [Planktothrix agardhii]MCB8782897.1 DNA-formamidopyrimidine glycosylase [Planktothrix agardhii 1808]MCF3606516.1 DNA-formamidopyrimidine glycosylase [Planktothrix agardhii 1033]CAD5954743.1 Formamidopyrimidine-DNA glycosylase [Planktothrix rubescens]MCB8759412.1 DNA-formamidopyrimidine glycosylase [Planktothrix agardhii 1813]MCB8764840.1 DNA-formamidopyrimidine glycosylase [Planktothrix agardhii 1809]
MPELPEVETVRQGLNQVTLNQTIVGGEVLLQRTLAYPFSVDEFLQGLTGVAIASWHRRGKYLLAELVKLDSQRTSGGWLGVHLRMTGQLLWVNPQDPLQKHTRIRLFFAENRELRFVDQRTFGKIWWAPPGQEVSSIITGLNNLGPEPFTSEFSVEYLQEQFKKRQRPIKSALLDQSLVAGVGNIYADESLFLSGISPTTPCSALTRPQLEQLHRHIIQVLKTSIEVGGTTIRNFLNVQGVNGNYGGTAWVYNRTGEPCRVCGTPIERLKLAGRSAHFCPKCQY